VKSFAEHHMRIDHLVVEGDLAAYRIVHRAKHTGEFFGIPPTGKEIRVTEMNIARLEGDKIAEQWSLWDGLGLLQQLGVVPPFGEGDTRGSVP
jgi:predicted ester cyclase